MAVDQDYLRASLERCLSRYFSDPCSIAKIDMRPFPSQSSFAIKELNLFLKNGRELNIVWKRVGRTGLLDEAAQVRLQGSESPQCELKSYGTLLKPELGSPLCYGTVVQQETGECWLFLEKVEGFQLNETGDTFIWKRTSRWTAVFQRSCGPSAMQLDWLAKYDAPYYRKWLIRAYSAVARSGQDDEGRGLQCLERLIDGCDQLTSQLVDQPQSVIHGEFYPANILVVPRPNGEIRICPVDWGTTAIGPAPMDVAALVSGAWTETERMEIAEAYRHSAFPQLPMPEFINRLNQCRMHLALKWIGWCQDWKPPREQAYDWLGEACRLAGPLGFA